MLASLESAHEQRTTKGAERPRNVCAGGADVQLVE